MTKYKLAYPKGSVGKATAFRRTMTDAEKKLWSAVRGNRLGVHFRRQVPQGPYYCDFLAPEVMLAVEVDGQQHYTAEGLAHDDEREEFLRKHGLRVLRFPNTEVLNSFDEVVRTIQECIHELRQDGER